MPCVILFQSRFNQVGVLTAVFHQPVRAGAVTTHGGVRTPLQAGRPRERPFQSVPETDAIQNRIQHVGHRAIVAVFGIGMMPGMMTRRLQNADILKERDNRSVFPGRAVRPFVELIGIGGQDGKQPDLPCQHAAQPREDDEQRGEKAQVPRALPPVELGHETRVMVMDNIWPGDVPANQRRVLAHIRVFKPMDESGDKFRGKDSSDSSQKNDDRCKHGVPSGLSLTRLVRQNDTRRRDQAFFPHRHPDLPPGVSIRFAHPLLNPG